MFVDRFDEPGLTPEGAEEHGGSQNPHPVAQNATRVGHPSAESQNPSGVLVSEDA